MTFILKYGIIISEEKPQIILKGCDYMLFKTFKQKVLCESEFHVSVYDKRGKWIESFDVDYINDLNINKVIELYDAKAKMISLNYNKAIGAIDIRVKIG